MFRDSDHKRVSSVQGPVPGNFHRPARKHDRRKHAIAPACNDPDGLSNKFGHIVLTTGNKSELAVGYCTIYGDMAGGLAVISDVPKTIIYELARSINREREIIPKSTIEKPPSAELKPGQKDQDTFPPYEILDEILRQYVEENLSARDIISHGFDKKTVRWVQRRADFNEYKREQAAPGIKVTSRAFGFGRKMPIAQKYVD